MFWDIFKISDKKGQVGIAGAAIAAVIGIIAILIFTTVYSALPLENVSSGALSLLNIVDLLLAASLVVGIALTMLVMRR